MVLKIRDGGSIQRKALYLALGVTLDGDRDVLGMWFQDTEGAKFGMQALNDLKQRGVRDILIACVDGLTGFPEAIEGIFPETTVQTCLVHLIRSSLKYVPRREREQVTRDLKPIYTAKDAEQAQAGSCARRSKREAASPTRTPPASSSTSPCRTPSRNGRGPATGRQRCWRSRSTSATGFPTLQTDRHSLTLTETPLHLT